MTGMNNEQMEYDIKMNVGLYQCKYSPFNVINETTAAWKSKT